MGIITIDLRKRQLIYEQIVENVKEQIGRGVICENDYMPSVRSLANELGINPNTIQKAYAELERQGIIRSVTGRGSIVVVGSEDIRGMNRERISEMVREMAREAMKSGMDLETFCGVAKEVFDGGTKGDDTL